MLSRALLGFALAMSITAVARKVRSLSVGGAITATIIGTITVISGWNWGVLLIIYFVSSTALSRVGRTRKEARTASIVEKGGERDAVQVLVNGALFAGASVAMLVRPDVRWIALGAGSLAASAADTWATEIGTLARGDPRSIVKWRRVPTGTSGAVSAPGTLGMFAGAAFIAAVMSSLGWAPNVVGHVFVGGVFGAVVDTLLGATMQTRRWCATCHRSTERLVHDCGTSTRYVGGLDWLDNDLVNFFSAMAGGLLAAFLSR